ncbi:MAG: hypothetical protein EOM20_06370 [Spartobacteria bacterium]|nr:hypothetical protein [Spartobacteria bacterium]
MNAGRIEERREQLKRARGKQILLVAGLLLGLALVAGIIIDARTIERRRRSPGNDSATEVQNIILDMDSAPYVDPDRLFSITAPAGWTVTQQPEGTPYNVTFRSRNGPEISIVATRVDYNNFTRLKKDIKSIEQQQGINAHIEEPGFIGREAIRRTMGLHHSKVVTYDFIEDHVAHHIQVSIPHSLTNRYEPVLMDIIETYEPLPSE